ncbi:exopolysaccharide biosynthesis protein [Lactobacillus sp. PV037]|uniref:tyrosine-protein phosphatase n=1 Tax=Lactobacillus sp. PV037 TaxID=2594496 RepID=UPI002240D90F|nr:CpsB/CapC family capsule biosynthesis tyrosine phosphatase [Lactobacillus sp. PV037]QNQ84412.1 exopolysaccharide biosynthesis protein [Lactobacillus sp. PV037]
MVLVDIHAHLLPGIDDGSPDMETSLQLAKAAVEDGITHALMTPHHLNGRYSNHKKDVIKLTEQFQEQLKQEKIDLTIFPSQEVRLSSEIPAALDSDDILFCDEDGTYMLLEMPSEDVPLYAKEMTYQLLARGITPIIVHPERNSRILKEPELLQKFLEQGCLTQVTASSYVGVFGNKIADLSERLIAAGQVATFASDAHSLAKRESKMTEAYDKLSKEAGSDVVAIFKQNAQDIINGENVSLDWQPLRRKKKFWIF